MKSDKNKTGYLGVSKSRSKTHPYRARLWNPKTKELLFLGVFKTAEAAAAEVERVRLLREKQGYVPYQKTTCKWGHVFQPHTVYTFTRKGSEKVYRRCRICSVEHGREYNRTRRKPLTEEQREKKREYGRNWMRVYRQRQKERQGEQMQEAA